MSESRRALQDRQAGNHCWGCGPENPRGFQLKSHRTSRGTVAHWTPHPEHCAGPPHVVNGGVLATLIDCHGVGCALDDAYRREGREPDDGGPPIWYVTGRLTVDYLAPTPLGPELTLAAEVTSREGRKTEVSVDLVANGVVTARGRILAVRVPIEWHAPPGA